jgi:hypothetical protein
VESSSVTDREVLANRSGMIFKNKDRTCLLIDTAKHRTGMQYKRRLKRNLNMKSRYRNLENVEHEMLCYTGNYWDHGNCK